MVARLVKDALWRSRWFYASGGLALMGYWLMYVGGGVSFLRIDIRALSLIFATFLGPAFGVVTMGLRGLRHLPVTNRDLWRATWVVATVVSAGVVLITKTISALLVTAFGGSPGISADSLLLSAVYDFVWAGAILPVVPLLVFAPAAGDARAGLSPWLAEIGQLIGLLVCIGLLIAGSGALPAHLGEFTTSTTAALIAGLSLAFGALAWTPKRGVLAGERVHPKQAAGPRGAVARNRLADLLTGIPRVVGPYLLAILMLPVGTWLALACYGVISESGPWWFVPNRPTVFDPADIGDRGLTYFVLLPCAIVTMLGLWAPWVRLLKVLPLSVRQINGVLLLTPFAAWTPLWVLGWSAYAFAYGAPQTFKVDFAFGMAAIASLAHAALLRFQGSAGTLWITAVIAGLLPQVVKLGVRDGTSDRVVFAIIGAIALAAAAIINHHTLTQSTSTSRAYRRPQPPFGLPAAPTGR